MTIAQLKASLPEGIVVRKVDGEYRVNFRGGSEDTAYYTDDIQDAADTARVMAQSCKGAI